ncbi:hypothetical protein LRP52_47545 [Photobacterium sp. ZSDE20]|uniref:Chromosome partition protein Smc n=1 Tax=Photobacterium pectinilyticum TaxID=2906793 RepID=A0ABT1N6Z3_9GAMM|nr:hypothetical protein [Photobacterium sp. ZSDE20]MCQ1060513.1 hypothetical protein [Photobacterium sp. ZSDE20]MDD1829806.1 hypothetical protein [Photobacterium sp. ZSDE20]
MSSWVGKLENHPLHETLTQLLNWVQIEVDEITDDISEVRRFENVIRRVQANLQSIDPELVAFGELDAFNNALRHQNIWQQVSTFSNNGNATHIRNANNYLTNSLNGKQWLIAPSIVGGQVEQEHLREAYDDLADKFQLLKEKFGNLEREKADLETTIENRRQEVDQQISQWQQQFSEAQERRSESYQDWKSDLEKNVSESNKELVNKTESKLEKLESDTSMFLSRLSEQSEQKHNRIQELYELASGDSISGGYAKTAKEESDQANLWRKISIGFIVVTVIWLLSAFCFYSSGGFHTVASQLTSPTEIASENIGVNLATLDWSRYLLTFSITGVLLFGAGYAGQQSTRHRDEARRTQRFALQVKALDPYISSLPEEEQIHIKKSLTEKFFDGVGERSSSDGEIHIPASMTGKLFQAVIDNVKGK